MENHRNYNGFTQKVTIGRAHSSQTHSFWIKFLFLVILLMPFTFKMTKTMYYMKCVKFQLITDYFPSMKKVFLHHSQLLHQQQHSVRENMSQQAVGPVSQFSYQNEVYYILDLTYCTFWNCIR